MKGIVESIVERQLEAFRADRFEIGLLHFADGTRKDAILREWSKDEVLSSVNWLKRQNAHGWNINIRPVMPNSLSVVDDCSADSIVRMKQQGFQPAMVVETSPGNYQAWMQHDRVLSPILGTAVAKDLAIGFEGDPSAASYRHFGRMAGFTNRKAKYEREGGLYPFVRLIESTGQSYTHAAAYVQAVEDRVLEQAREQQRIRESVKQYERPGNLKTIDDFRNDSRYRGDNHRVDQAYAIYALSHGLNASEVGGEIASRDLSKKGSERQQHDYVRRTIEGAERYIGRFARVSELVLSASQQEQGMSR